MAASLLVGGTGTARRGSARALRRHRGGYNACPHPRRDVLDVSGSRGGGGGKNCRRPAEHQAGCLRLTGDGGDSGEFASRSNYSPLESSNYSGEGEPLTSSAHERARSLLEIGSSVIFPVGVWCVTLICDNTLNL